MKRILSILILAALTATLVNSCKSDYSLNAPYDRIPLVYGILDPTESTQYVKINRTYLADADNSLYTGVNDSLLYETVSAKVEEYVDGSLVTEFPLAETWVQNIDEGLFYSDSQKVYYFDTPSGLNEEAIYKVVIDVAEESESITAETNIVKTSSLKLQETYKQIVQFNGLRFASIKTLEDGVFLDENVRWITTLRGKRYDLSLRFHYWEYKTDGSYIPVYMDWSLGSQSSTTTNGGSELNKLATGEAFYDMIAGRLQNYANESGVEKRVVKNVELTIIAGNENLDTYIELNEPATGVVTEPPSYTNIEGGSGLFASKTQISLNTELNNYSMYALWGSEKTKDLKFVTEDNDIYASILNVKGVDIRFPHP